MLKLFQDLWQCFLKSGEGKLEQDICLAAKLQLSSKSKHC